MTSSKRTGLQQNHRADEIAELIKEARGFGDLSENASMTRRRTSQGKLYSRIAEAGGDSAPRRHCGRVRDGLRQNLHRLPCGGHQSWITAKQLPEYTIVGSQEANVMERKVSEDSPFGKALMGTKAGDEITVEAPRGVIHYRVDSIER